MFQRLKPGYAELTLTRVSRCRRYESRLIHRAGIVQDQWQALLNRPRPVTLRPASAAYNQRKRRKRRWADGVGRISPIVQPEYEYVTSIRTTLGGVAPTSALARIATGKVGLTVP